MIHVFFKLTRSYMQVLKKKSNLENLTRPEEGKNKIKTINLATSMSPRYTGKKVVRWWFKAEMAN